MKHQEWRSHIQRRTDFATRITHLTKSNNGLSAFQNLIKILSEKKLYGSTQKSGFIVGTESAVCFQDVPLLSLAENIEYEKEHCTGKIRYEAYGLRFNKCHLYQKGARPVIYGETEYLKEILPETEYWRIVNHNLADVNHLIDWTHEREWRIKGSLEFKYKDIEIIVYSDDDYQNMVKYFQDNNPSALTEIHGIIPLQSVLN